MTVRQVTAIVPAAGKGTRLAPFPCPKELYPIGFQKFTVGESVQQRPKVISQYIVEHLVGAGATELFIILGDGKQDIMSYYGDGHRFGVRIGYLFQEQLNGMPFAIDLAYPWAKGSDVVFGMPDTIVQPDNAFEIALKRHRQTSSDLTLGLFPTATPQKFGMVEFDENDRVLSTIDKPKSSDLTHMWGFACWSDRFTELLHEFTTKNTGATKELVLGDVFNLALDRGMRVSSVRFDAGKYIDIGTAAELDNALAQFRLTRNAA